MSYLAGIHDLAYCFTRVGTSVDAGVRQDWVGLGANIGALAGKAVWYAKGQSAALKSALEAVGKKILPTPTAIVDVTMVVVVVVDLMNGFGAPDVGGGYASGSDKFKLVDANLKAAKPDPRDWSGDAADAYIRQNAELRAMVAELQAIDKKMQALVAAQGAEVKHAHQAMAILGFALVMSQGIALVLYMIPIFGPEISLLFQVVAALAAATTVVVTETLCLARSMNAANDAEKVAAEYLALGKRAELPGEFVTLEITGAEETKVGSFTAISESMSTFTRTPTVASLASQAGANAPTDHQELLSAFSASEAPVGETPETPQVPEDPTTPTTPTTPAFTMPTMAQVSQFTGQIGKISNDLAQPLGVANSTMGSVQQIVTSAQQSAQQNQVATMSGEAAPSDGVAEAAPVEQFAAAGGTESAGGQRAPVAAPSGEDHGRGATATPKNYQ